MGAKAPFIKELLRKKGPLSALRSRLMGLLYSKMELLARSLTTPATVK
jgi:hypothetical protein